MTDSEKRCMTGAFESLTQAVAWFDCADENLPEPNPSTELGEAIERDTRRACRAMERLLRSANALPEWAENCYYENDDELPF